MLRSLLADKLVEVGKYLRVHSLGLLLLKEMMTIDEDNLKIWNNGLERPALYVVLDSKGLGTDVLVASDELGRHSNSRTVPWCSKPPVPMRPR